MDWNFNPRMQLYGRYALEAQDFGGIVVWDAPVMIETGGHAAMDRLIVVVTDPEMRKKLHPVSYGQAQILERIRELRASENAGVILVTHDLGLIAERAHEVVVMYAGRIVEQAETAELFANPQHPYTRGLMASIPKPGEEGRKRLRTIRSAAGRVISRTLSTTPGRSTVTTKPSAVS